MTPNFCNKPTSYSATKTISEKDKDLPKVWVYWVWICKSPS